MQKINDIDLKNWKSYDKIITDSLWIIKSRDECGIYMLGYHGNFIPQIPRQAMLRYTRKGETVIDPFLGLGTTLIECKRLGRNGIGVELVPKVGNRAKFLINKETKSNNARTSVILGDSTCKSTFESVKKRLEELGQEKAQLIIMHPPYHDVIKFSNNPQDLSNAANVMEFLKKFGDVVDNTYDLLDEGRFFVLVMADNYRQGELVPLGFLTMQKVLETNYKLKGIIVKNMVGSERGEGVMNSLWRYRALKGGFYIFKHEYIMVFQKKKEVKNENIRL